MRTTSRYNERRGCRARWIEKRHVGGLILVLRMGYANTSVAAKRNVPESVSPSRAMPRLGAFVAQTAFRRG